MSYKEKIEKLATKVWIVESTLPIKSGLGFDPSTPEDIRGEQSLRHELFIIRRALKSLQRYAEMVDENRAKENSLDLNA